MALKDIIAMTATVLIVSGYIPQIIKGYRTKSLKDISWGLLLIVGLGVALWTFYGVLIKDVVFVVANIIILVSISVLTIMKWHYQR